MHSPINTLQHTATHCNTLQHAATNYSTLQRPTLHCNKLQHIATRCCKMLQHAETKSGSKLIQMRFTIDRSTRNCVLMRTPINTLQHTATQSNILQHTATHSTNCKALQHIATKVDSKLTMDESRVAVDRSVLSRTLMCTPIHHVHIFL